MQSHCGRENSQGATGSLCSQQPSILQEPSKPVDNPVDLTSKIVTLCR